MIASVPSASRYDVVVVGGGLAGVVVATLLAKQGRRVALVEPRSEWGGRYPVTSIGGLAVASGPTLAMDYYQFGAADAYFEAIGLSLAVLTRQGAVVNREPIQTIHGRHRVTLASNRNELIEELQREYGESQSRIDALLTDLEASRSALAPLFDRRVSDSSAGRWTSLRRQAAARAFVSRLSGTDVAGYAEARGWPPSLGKYLAMLSAFVASGSEPQSPASEVFRLGTVMRGLVTLPEGTAGLCRLLVSRFEALGGHVIRASVTKVDPGPRPSLEVGGQRLDAGTLIVNSSKPPGATAARVSDAQGFSNCTLVVTVPENCIPEPMARHLLVVDGKDEDREAWTLTQVGLQADERRGLTVSLRERTRVDGERAMERMSPALIDLMPFSQGNIAYAGCVSDRDVAAPIGDDLWGGSRWRPRRVGWAQAGRFPVWWLADAECPWIRDASEYHAALLVDRIVEAA